MSGCLTNLCAVAMACVVSVGGGFAVGGEDGGGGDGGGAADWRAVLTGADKLFSDGNFAEALAEYDKVLADPAFGASVLAGDADAEADSILNTAVYNCLAQLARQAEVDARWDALAEQYADNWAFMAIMARVAWSKFPHRGMIVAGEFFRDSGWREGGRWVDSTARDRIKVLRWLEAARVGMERWAAENDDEGAQGRRGRFLREYADAWQYGMGANQSWRLTALTDLDVLPDYEENTSRDATLGAPVDADGRPIFHAVPETWEAAKTDGERWRWLLAQAEKTTPEQRDRARLAYTDFLRAQFDVQTMAYYGQGRGRLNDPDPDQPAGPFAVRTLEDNETIARLTTGVQRFILPEDARFIDILRELSAGNGAVDDTAARSLFHAYLDRMQYEKAAAVARDARTRRPDLDWWKKALDQVTRPAGCFDTVATLPAGTAPVLNLAFRNAHAVELAAQRLDEAALLDDVQSYLKNPSENLDYQKYRTDNIGWRVIGGNEAKYLKGEPVAWTEKLEPADGHFTRRVPLTMPFTEAGAYLLTATFPRGEGQNDDGKDAGAKPVVARMVLFLADCAIVQKPVDKGQFYYVADARTGAPAAGATLSFFGFKTEQKDDRVRVETREIARQTDDDGGLIIDAQAIPDGYQWLVRAATPAGGFAWLGNLWFWRPVYSDGYDNQYSQTKAFVVTDRPVYRPGQKVGGKVWVGHNQYDRDTGSPFAGRTVTVKVNDARGQEISATDATADGYGGVEFNLELPEAAPLGVYQISVLCPPLNPGHSRQVGGGSFRVEEYKKPEFAVTIDAPDKPVALGEAAKVKVKARYYFGAPVTEAKMNYTVTRNEHSATWYPPWAYDWFYGPGYWWFGYDYPWWPGWRSWGCVRPVMLFAFHAPRWGGSPPEIILRGEAQLDADGGFEIAVDTALAKEMQGDLDHRYSIEVEVTDASRRTINGSGSFLAAREPFKVYAWTERGYWDAPSLRAGDPLEVRFQARSLDGRGVPGEGTATLYRVRFDDDGAPKEEAVQTWPIATDPQGRAELKIEAAEPGQYRVAFACRDAAGREQTGATVLTVRGPDADTADWRFAELEIVADRQDYQPGDTVKLRVNADTPDATVLVFIRPVDGVAAGRPTLVKLAGKSAELSIPVTERDMPNFFVEALAVTDGRVHQEIRALAVPPAKRFLNVDIRPEKDGYAPGAEAAFTLAVTTEDGQPFQGQCAVTLYDQSVEYIAGGGIPNIRDFFWKWLRSNQSHNRDSLQRAAQWLSQLPGEPAPLPRLGVFGGQEADWKSNERVDGRRPSRKARRMKLRDSRGDADFYDGEESPGRLVMGMGFSKTDAGLPSLPTGPVSADAASLTLHYRGGAVMEIAGKMEMNDEWASAGGGGELAAASVRENFADTAYWTGTLETDAKGQASFTVPLPENLTTWKARVWTLARGNRVGEGSATIVTKKDFLLRLQAPRFFTQGDNTTLSAIVHNYRADPQNAAVALELEGGVLEADGETVRRVVVPAGGEVRVDWTVRAARPGQATVRMSARSPEDADAMQMKFPVNVHGAPRFVPAAGVLPDGKPEAVVTVKVPAERLPDQSVLTVQFSPSAALAAVEALPYLIQQPHETADVELHRFVPAMLARKLLTDLGLDLEDIAKNRANLNAAELGDPARRAAGWGEREYLNPRRGMDERRRVDAVFDSKEMRKILDNSLAKLARQQRSDGGWNWLAGYGGEGDAHVTATVVHGLRQARAAGVALTPGLLENGREWLLRYQNTQIEKLREYETTTAARKAWAAAGRQGDEPAITGKAYPDPLDALVLYVLTDAEVADNAPDAYMLTRLYDRRVELPVYCRALLGLVFDEIKDAERLAMVRRNLEQFFVRDDENQTGHLRLPEDSWWWCWYGLPLEANAWYLKLLARVEPKGDDARRLAKYLVNNRRHRAAWDSPRLTAYAVDALLDFARAAGEAAPRQTVTVLLDGREALKREITPENLFVADNRLVLAGIAVEEGEHTITLRRDGEGPLYYNVYLEYFSFEDPIPAAGLDLKVNRAYYRLVPETVEKDAADARGAATKIQTRRYRREPIPDPFAERADGAGVPVASGDLLEIELTIETKNDYEYLVLEDPKPAGVENLDLRSGYNGNELGAYVEFRDAKTVFYVTRLAQGRHSVSYRVRAEIPGAYAALPTQAAALYAPELRGNANEQKLSVTE